MNDMTTVIQPKSDQVNADDFIGGPITYTIEGVAITPGTEQPVSIKLVGEHRVWRPCKSMSRCLVAAWGPDAKVYSGRSVTLYRDPKVKWGGMEVGGIRISHMSHIERDMLIQLTATKGKRTPHTVKPLAIETIPHQNATRAKAEAWVKEHTTAVEACDSLARLDAVIAKGKAAVAKLDRDHHDLREIVMDAYSARGEALEAEAQAIAAPQDADADPFGED